jgi:hypothetical protein
MWDDRAASFRCLEHKNTPPPVKVEVSTEPRQEARKLREELLSSRFVYADVANSRRI